MHLQQSFRQSLRQTHGLTQRQRQAVDTEQLQQRRDLVSAVYGETFEPRASCPKCRHVMTDMEIMRGFKNDPKDYTTGCPKCKERFLPQLYRSMLAGSKTVAFYCPAQTLDQLNDLAEVPLEEMQTRHAAVYNSAVVHFGGLAQAFKKLGKTYTFEADLDWRKQVEPFLGKMPDTVIAELLHASVKAIRKLRSSKGIPRFDRRKAAENLS